jgi:L-threonylcarbamoyladenylate synthase
MPPATTVDLPNMTTSAQLDADLIVRAAALLRQAELVAFPTETVYGLGADASNLKALSKLYATKGRPADHPVIVHLFNFDQVNEWAIDVPDFLEPLAQRFWPGPLTVVLRRSARVLDQVTGGQDTVALRVPAHPIALALLREFGGGLAAPSANRFGRISPTRAEDVTRDLGEAVSLVLDGGACQVGIESTILDLSVGGTARILRPGMILGADIEAVIAGAAEFKTGKLSASEPAQSKTPIRVPGALPSHYAPQTPLILLPPSQLIAGIEKLAKQPSKRLAVLAFQPNSSNLVQVTWHQAANEPTAYARELYSRLRGLDELKSDWIVVEQPPDDPQWSGVIDRLRRAAKPGDSL